LADAAIYTELSHFASPDPCHRVWPLTPEQNDTFQWIFLQLLNEHTARRDHRERAASAWLQLLLITVQRWASSTASTVTLPNRANAEVLKLWHLINAAVTKPNNQLNDLYSAPNYDSVRHMFRKAFGCSPRVMLQRLRMEHAKNLLLESSLSIKEVSARVGYAAQHDLNRMFHRHTGMAPSKWRANPLARAATK
jgi:transcriptional regulator GlxA family with amidase domain